MAPFSLQLGSLSNDDGVGSLRFALAVDRIFIVLSERQEQTTSNHSIMFANSFATLKQYFEVTELNKTLKAANC